MRPSKSQKLFKWTKQQYCRCDFWYISDLCSLFTPKRWNSLMGRFMKDVNTPWRLFLPFLILCVIPKNSSLWKIASICHFKEVGVNATKFVFCYVTKMHWPRGPGRRHTGTRQLVITLATLTLFYKLLIQKDSFIYKQINSVLLELCCFTLAREPLLLLKLKGTV